MGAREILETWYRRSEGRFFDIRVFGRAVAGSTDAGQHSPTPLDLSGDVLVIRFNVTETLTVTGLRSVEADERGGLSVSRADAVRFEWYYPGLAEEPENRCTEEYRLAGETLEHRLTGPIAAHFADEELPLGVEPAVRLA